MTICTTENQPRNIYGYIPDGNDFMDALHRVISGTKDLLDCICTEQDEQDEPVIMVAAVPGQPIKIINSQEANTILACFGEDDVIEEAPAGVSIAMSYDEDDVREIDDHQYVIGPVLFYNVNEDGYEVSLTAQDIYLVRLAVEERTVMLGEKGTNRKTHSIRID